MAQDARKTWNIHHILQNKMYKFKCTFYLVECSRVCYLFAHVRSYGKCAFIYKFNEIVFEVKLKKVQILSQNLFYFQKSAKRIVQISIVVFGPKSSFSYFSEPFQLFSASFLFFKTTIELQRHNIFPYTIWYRIINHFLWIGQNALALELLLIRQFHCFHLC